MTWRKTASGIFVVDSPEWGGKTYPGYRGFLGIGNGSQVSAGQLPSSPAIQQGAAMWMQNNDAGTTGFVGDIIYVTGRNFTNLASASVFVAASGTDIAHLLSNGSSTSASGWNGFCNTTFSNGTNGPNWASIKLFSARFSPVNGTVIALAGYRPVFICGAMKNVGDASGLHSGVAVTSTTPVSNWMTLIPYCGFYFDPAASGNYQALTSDGAGNFTQVDTGIQPTQTATDTLVFTFDGTTVRFYINGSKVAQITTTLPPSATGMGIQTLTGVVNGTATTISKFRMGRGVLNYQ